MCAESPHNLCVTTKKMNQDFNGIVGKTDPCVHEFVCVYLISQRLTGRKVLSRSNVI